MARLQKIYRDEIVAKLMTSLTVTNPMPVSYTNLRAHETVLDLVCRLLLENKKETSCNYIKSTPAQITTSAVHVKQTDTNNTR